MSKQDAVDVQAVAVAAAAQEVSFVEKAKSLATGPAAKSIGAALGAGLMGALGGFLAIEARERGYLGKRQGQIQQQQQ